MYFLARQQLDISVVHYLSSVAAGHRRLDELDEMELPDDFELIKAMCLAHAVRKWTSDKEENKQVYDGKDKDLVELVRVPSLPPP